VANLIATHTLISGRHVQTNLQISGPSSCKLGPFALWDRMAFGIYSQRLLTGMTSAHCVPVEAASFAV
jgi:hypothetical protein